jgi:hypothetical protein
MLLGYCSAQYHKGHTVKQKGFLLIQDIAVRMQIEKAHLVLLVTQLEPTLRF